MVQSVASAPESATKFLTKELVYPFHAAKIDF